MERKIERLEKYMKMKGLNDNQVTKECGLSVGLINQARKGKSDIGAKAAEKILNKYQDLSRVWFLTGEGDMLVTSQSETAVSTPSTDIISKFLEELAAQRGLTEEAQRQTAKAQEQMDKLIAMLQERGADSAPKRSAS